jgi:hypothetical protein
VLEAAGQAAGGLLGAEVEQELGGGREQDVVAGQDRLIGDVLDEHRFAEALGRDQKSARPEHHHQGDDKHQHGGVAITRVIIV